MRQWGKIEPLALLVGGDGEPNEHAKNIQNHKVLYSVHQWGKSAHYIHYTVEFPLVDTPPMWTLLLNGHFLPGPFVLLVQVSTRQGVHYCGWFANVDTLGPALRLPH